MKSVYLIIFASLFLITPLIAQNTASKKEALQNAYSSYFNAERETIYLHFNKNIYLTKEPIWFKGYVFDKKNGIPFFNTTNVFVALYDSKGKEIDNKLFFAQKGVFTGSFDINDNLETGEYTVRAYTNWMNNFKEDESYASYPIQIINPNSTTAEATQLTKPSYDLQFLPEGGYCISDVTNTIGFKIINCEAEGIDIEGVIVNSKNIEVANFKSNAFGLGKFDLLMVKDEVYTAKYIINKIDYTTKLPKSKNEGFTISINNYTNASVTYINLKTNKETLQKEAGKIYYLAINQNEKSSVVEIEINNLKETNTIPIQTSNLVSGVNTITFFDDQLNPLLERLIFNYDEALFIKSSLYTTKNNNDSIPINLKTTTKNNIPISANLSVAILPKESIAYTKKEEIISAFLIAPYIKGYIQNPYYYFSNVDRLKKYDLDLLLLTQGWSKYNWDNIKNGAQELTHSFDAGLSIKGIANIPKTNRVGYTVQMFSIPNRLNEQAFIDEKNNFYFNNYFLKDSAQVNISVLRDGVKVNSIKPFTEIVNNNKALVNHPFKTKNHCEFKSETIYENQTSIAGTFANAGQVLDTVSLSYIRIKDTDELENEKSYIANVYSKGIKIDSITKRYYNYVADIINANGFVVDQLEGAGQVRIKNRNPVSFLASNEPLLIIDDVNYDRNYDIIYNMNLEEIDEIFIDPNGNGYGSRGSAGIIRIYKKKGVKNKTTYQNNSANEVIINGGFSVEKEYYIPEFYALSKSNFLRYGSINWKSNIETDANGNATYNIFNTNINEVVVIIQGFTEDGKLISEIKEVQLINQ